MTIDYSPDGSCWLRCEAKGCHNAAGALDLCDVHRPTAVPPLEKLGTLDVAQLEANDRTWARMSADEQQAAADAQALADVRTLDEWAIGAEWREWHCKPWGIHAEQRCVCHDPDADRVDHIFRGKDADAARHAAAEWVRGQAPSVPDPDPTLFAKQWRDG